MNINQEKWKELKGIYPEIKSEIEKRLQEFRILWELADDKDIFVELTFCLFTPQSKAKVCWGAVEELKKRGLIFDGDFETIVKILNVVRFKNNKTKYLLSAREKFFGKNGISLKNQIAELENDFERRKWLVGNVKGIGYKEGSHFLRNIGFYEELAILDRHVLKNLVKLNVIEKIPKTISKNKYFTIEEKMKSFAKKVDIPLAHLDFLLWYKEAGEIFK